MTRAGHRPGLRLAALVLGLAAAACPVAPVVRAAMAAVPELPAVGGAGEDGEPSCRAPDAGLVPATGPYAGRIVELVHGHPIPGALVIVAWFRDCEAEADRRASATLLATTDSAGRFVIDPAPVERTLPRPWLPPRILVFRGGFTPFPPSMALQPYPTLWAAASRIRERGGEIRLRPIADPEDRSAALNHVAHAVNRLPEDAKHAVWGVLEQELEAIAREMRRRGTGSGAGPGSRP